MPTRIAKKENGFDRLARLMQEGFVEVETNLRKEIHEATTATENVLRTEMRDMEERLQYRISKSAMDIYHHLEGHIEPKLDDYEHRIVKLEKAR